nr:hypothetical protein [Pseudomonas cichorii]
MKNLPFADLPLKAGVDPLLKEVTLMQELVLSWHKYAVKVALAGMLPMV